MLDKAHPGIDQRSFKAEKVFERLEHFFNLPTKLVQGNYFRCWQIKNVGKNFPTFCFPVFSLYRDPSQRFLKSFFPDEMLDHVVIGHGNGRSDDHILRECTFFFRTNKSRSCFGQPPKSFDIPESLIDD